MEQKFKIGDRVRYVHGCESLYGKGKSGTIVAKNGGFLGVEFDEAMDGLHNLGGKCKNKHGWWCIEEWFEHLNAQRIVIEEEGRETVATLYVDNKPSKTAKARCHPADKQDFKIGAKLALDRLFEKPKRDTDFKPGDIVRFRTWEDMENEFGSDSTGVNTYGYTYFTFGMRYLCGKIFTVKLGGDYVTLFNHPTRPNTTSPWAITSDMLEKVDLSELSK